MSAQAESGNMVRDRRRSCMSYLRDKFKCETNLKRKNIKTSKPQQSIHSFKRLLSQSIIQLCHYSLISTDRYKSLSLALNGVEPSVVGGAMLHIKAQNCAHFEQLKTFIKANKQSTDYTLLLFTGQALAQRAI